MCFQISWKLPFTYQVRHLVVPHFPVLHFQRRVAVCWFLEIWARKVAIANPNDILGIGLSIRILTIRRLKLNDRCKITCIYQGIDYLPIMLAKYMQLDFNL